MSILSIWKTETCDASFKVFPTAYLMITFFCNTPLLCSVIGFRVPLGLIDRFRSGGQVDSKCRNSVTHCRSVKDQKN